MSDKIVVSYHDSLVRESDLKLLKGRNWINDSLLAFWFEYLQKEIFKKVPNFIFISPEVTQLLKMSDVRELSILLDPLNVKDGDWVFFPVNDNSSFSAGGSHWSLLVYSKQHHKWTHYDTQQGSNYDDAQILTQRINQYLNNNTLQYTEAQCTQQDNNYDCGAFVMIHAQKIADLASQSQEIDCCIVPKQAAKEIRESVLLILYELRIS